MPGLLAEAELRDPVHQRRRAELLGDRDRADVRRVREDLRDASASRCRAARRRGCTRSATWIEYGSVNFVVGVTSPLRERAGDRDELERRAGLVGVGDGAVALQSRTGRSAALFASKPGACAIASTAPVRGSSTIAVADLRAPLRDGLRAAPPRRSPGSCGRSSGRRRAPALGRRADRCRSRARTGRGRSSACPARPASCWSYSSSSPASPLLSMPA